MSLGLISKIVKGVKAARMVNETNELNERRINVLLESFKKSKTVEWMLTGDRYYVVDNDILSGLKKTGNDKYRADNRIAHAKYKDMVDEKVSYLLSKPYSIKCDDETYLKAINDVLGKSFQYTLYKMGYESSNKGIGWLHVYVDENGKFQTMIIPSEQCVPVWRSIEHKELEYMIRFYDDLVWQGDSRKTITNIEVWSRNGVEYYRKDGNVIFIDPIKNFNENGIQVGHHAINGVETSWEKIPFVPFKNNFKEIPDIKFVKTLIDNYDKTRSKSANYVEDLANYIIAVYGYTANNASELKRNIKDHNMMFFDEKENGSGAEIITPKTELTASKEHWEQLKKDVVENGQSVLRDPDKIGNTPSGIALQILYAGLDLKASAMSTEFKNAFADLLYFVNKYLEIHEYTHEKQDVDIVFNVDMKSDESQTIANCRSSKGIISDETIIANHPWVGDVSKEKELLDKQLNEHPFNDKVPIKEKGIEDE